VALFLTKPVFEIPVCAAMRPISDSPGFRGATVAWQHERSGDTLSAPRSITVRLSLSGFDARGHQVTRMAGTFGP
jgi:hypothetical protein